MNPAQPYSAAQIANALGKTKRAVLAALRDVPASSQVMASGNPASAWLLATLPETMRAELSIIATKRGFRDAAHLLSAPSQTWQPPIPLAQVAPHCLDKAAKTQRALARVLALQNDFTRSSAELEQLGLADYQAAFGYTIT